MRQRWGDKPKHELYLTRFASQAVELRHRLAEIDAELALEAAPPADADAADRDASLQSTHSRFRCVETDDFRPAAPESQQAQERPQEPLPTRIGRYDVRRLLGEGAFRASV